MVTIFFRTSCQGDIIGEVIVTGSLRYGHLIFDRYFGRVRVPIRWRLWEFGV